MVYQGAGRWDPATTKVPGPFVVAGPAGWPGPGRKPSQHSTFFGKIAIFNECCDGFYCKAKTTTKVSGPFVAEMTFAQIKPAKINLSLFGRLWQRSEPVPSAPGRPERGATRTLVRERRLEGRDGVLGAGAASSLKDGLG